MTQMQKIQARARKWLEPDPLLQLVGQSHHMLFHHLLRTITWSHIGHVHEKRYSFKRSGNSNLSLVTNVVLT
jgi:hypothetical protein